MTTEMPYSTYYDNPPSIIESLSLPPTALHAEEFVGDTYGPFGLKKRNVNPDDSSVNKFTTGVKETLRKSNEMKKSLRTALRELTVHLFFLVVVCIIAFSTCSSSTYYFTKVMSDLFTNSKGPSQKTFIDVSTMDDVWDYNSNQLLSGLYWAPLISNTSIVDTTGNESLIEEAMIFYENRLLGAPRIRMLKVLNNSCTVVDSFAREIKACYAQYDKEKEDKATFGPKDNNIEAFHYTTADELENDDLWGTIATYSGGGFVQTLSINDYNTSYNSIAYLKSNRWIDRGTRLVLIDFSMYNGNLNLFCVVKLIFELPATGGVIPTSQFNSMRLIRYVNTFDYLVLACEGIFIAFTIFFIIEELFDVCKLRLGYLKEFWNIIDLVVISLSIVSILLSVKRTLLSRDRINKLLEGQLKSAPFDDVVSAENSYNNIAAILLFFVWIKVFKYISFNKTMSQLSATLSRSAKDIGGFAVMFFVFFFAYAQFGYLVFGTQNMFLAIINDTYVEVKAELARQSDDFQVAAFFSKGWYRLLRVFRLTDEIPTMESNIDYDAWKTALRRSGYSDSQINEKFAKFEVLSWKKMDPELRDELEEELENEKKEKEKRAEDHRDVIVIGRRVEHIESAILSIASRIEEVAGRLRTVELEKVRTREHYNRIHAQDVIGSGSNNAERNLKSE